MNPLDKGRGWYSCSHVFCSYDSYCLAKNPYTRLMNEKSAHRRFQWSVLCLMSHGANKGLAVLFYRGCRCAIPYNHFGVD